MKDWFIEYEVTTSYPLNIEILSMKHPQLGEINVRISPTEVVKENKSQHKIAIFVGGIRDIPKEQLMHMLDEYEKVLTVSLQAYNLEIGKFVRTKTNIPEYPMRGEFVFRARILPLDLEEQVSAFLSTNHQIQDQNIVNFLSMLKDMDEISEFLVLYGLLILRFGDNQENLDIAIEAQFPELSLLEPRRVKTGQGGKGGSRTTRTKVTPYMNVRNALVHPKDSEEAKQAGRRVSTLLPKLRKIAIQMSLTASTPSTP